MSTASHPAFKLVKEESIASLNVVVQEFEHIATGAQHIHLQTDNEENVFLVALRTVPEDSTGVAHILEHTALCGSKKYPVRDPFFMMTRRSINTFMNAFTSSDWTAYPFASLNKKDFNNLLDVYLDAVFFSRLDPLDFAQEGHRLEFEKADDPSSPLVFKGVVFNEMKGAMSSVPSQLWHTLSRYLFPTSTYHFNSGGEPDCIPDLSYEELVEFYKTHYHPSNAVFMTYGDITAKTHQEKFENQVLQHFKKLSKKIVVADEKRYYSPISVQESYPCNEDNLENKTHVVVAWLLGQSTDLTETMRLRLLSSVLLDNSATPLMHALESTELGQAPSPLCGLDDSQKELSFMCGLEGCSQDAVEDVEKLIIETLTQVIEEGIAQEDIESALHQLELHQREIGGDSYPYGLQLILTALTAATHYGDPVQQLNLEAALKQLRQDIQDPDFIQKLTQQYLIENPHRVRLVLSPDKDMSSRKEAAEKARLEKIRQALTDSDVQQIIEQSKALEDRQNKKDDESILPKVTLSDVPKEEVDVAGEKRQSITCYPTGTNGLVYQQTIYSLPDFKQQQLEILPLYSQCVSELGVGELSYLDVQRKQASVTGGISGFSSIRTTPDNPHNTNGYFIYSGRALNRNQKALTELLSDTISSLRFDEHSRITELVAQIKARKEQSIPGNGHSLAMIAATSGICAAANLTHTTSGLAGISKIKTLDAKLKKTEARTELADQLAAIHQAITNNEPQSLLIAEQQYIDEFCKVIENTQPQKKTKTPSTFELPTLEQQVHQAWLINSGVNFCAKAYQTVPMEHPDAAALTVLGGVLRNGFLHKAIREQGGAYGGGASQDSSNGAFRFYSYRDPRIEETLTDFDRAVEWLLAEEQPWQRIEEAILGTISSLDKSESPAGRVKRCFYASLHGRTLEKRQQFRERVLAVTYSDLARVASQYLQPEKANCAIICDTSSRTVAEKLQLDIMEI